MRRYFGNADIARRDLGVQILLNEVNRTLQRMGSSSVASRPCRTLGEGLSSLLDGHAAVVLNQHSVRRFLRARGCPPGSALADPVCPEEAP